MQYFIFPCSRAGQTTAREINLCGPPARTECVDYVALYHRVLNNFFIAISSVVLNTAKDDKEPQIDVINIANNDKGLQIDLLNTANNDEELGTVPQQRTTKDFKLGSGKE